MLRKQLDALAEEFSLYSLDVGHVNKGESLTRTICLYLGVAMFFYVAAPWKRHAETGWSYFGLAKVERVLRHEKRMSLYISESNSKGFTLSFIDWETSSDILD